MRVAEPPKRCQVSSAGGRLHQAAALLRLVWNHSAESKSEAASVATASLSAFSNVRDVRLSAGQPMPSPVVTQTDTHGAYAVACEVPDVCESAEPATST